MKDREKGQEKINSRQTQYLEAFSLIRKTTRASQGKQGQQPSNRKSASAVASHCHYVSYHNPEFIRNIPHCGLKMPMVSFLMISSEQNYMFLFHLCSSLILCPIYMHFLTIHLHFYIFCINSISPCISGEGAFLLFLWF